MAETGSSKQERGRTSHRNAERAPDRKETMASGV
ncbi:MAG: hypothetical protein QOG92_424, partial [Verrucomicrobiota bacterium]|nr:hypothetical protein [Verrucomicrobiota bacterium]